MRAFPVVSSIVLRGCRSWSDHGGIGMAIDRSLFVCTFVETKPDARDRATDAHAPPSCASSASGICTSIARVSHVRLAVTTWIEPLVLRAECTTAVAKKLLLGEPSWPCRTARPRFPPSVRHEIAFPHAAAQRGGLQTWLNGRAAEHA